MTALTMSGLPPSRAGGNLAIVLTGGGARAAYQIGFLRCLARHMPATRVPIITGISAGAINAAFLAAYSGEMNRAVEELSELWRSLTPERVFRVGTWPLTRNLLRWGARLISGGAFAAPAARSLVDTAPLSELLHRELAAEGGHIQGIEDNLRAGDLTAVALSTLDYSTGQTVTWVQGRDIEEWERPNRLGVKCRLTVNHIMASAALPLIFPAIQLDGSWYGDGGIRMSAPLAPAIHLGADRILAVSTRYGRSREEADRPAIAGYPPPAQVAGKLLNAIFLDSIDQDAERLRRINRLLDSVPIGERDGLRPIELLVLRPSQDLGKLAASYEPRLPGTFRYLTRGLGTRETDSPDLLSMLMFQHDYLSELIEIGDRDAENQLEEIGRLLGW